MELIVESPQILFDVETVKFVSKVLETIAMVIQAKLFHSGMASQLQ